MSTSPQSPLPDNPYAAPAARVADAVRADEFVLAGRGTRLGAAFLDGLVLGVPIGLLAIGLAIVLPAYRSGHRGDALAPAAYGIIGLAVLAVVAAVVAINCVLLHRYGQTIAKRWLGIKVVRTDGNRCALSRIIFLRWLPVTVVGAIPYLGIIMRLLDPLMIFRDDHRCLHDLIADTKVVKA